MGRYLAQVSRRPHAGCFASEQAHPAAAYREVEPARSSCSAGAAVAGRLAGAAVSASWARLDHVLHLRQFQAQVLAELRLVSPCAAAVVGRAPAPPPGLSRRLVRSSVGVAARLVIHRRCSARSWHRRTACWLTATPMSRQLDDIAGGQAHGHVGADRPCRASVNGSDRQQDRRLSSRRPRRRDRSRCTVTLSSSRVQPSRTPVRVRRSARSVLLRGSALS